MAVLNNFYSFLGIIVVFTIVLAAPNYSLVKKFSIIIVFTVILSLLDNPDLFTSLLREIKMGLHYLL